MSATDTPPIPFRWYFSVAALLFIFVVVGIYSTRMADNTTGYDQQQAVLRQARLDKMQAADRTNLTTADWIDPTKGTVRIPIDEAMTEEVAVLKAKPVAVGTALTVIARAPAAAAAGAPAGTNAAPAATDTPPASTNAPTADTDATPAPDANPPPTK